MMAVDDLERGLINEVDRVPEQAPDSPIGIDSDAEHTDVQPDGLDKITENGKDSNNKRIVEDVQESEVENAITDNQEIGIEESPVTSEAFCQDVGRIACAGCPLFKFCNPQGVEDFVPFEEKKVLDDKIENTEESTVKFQFNDEAPKSGIEEAKETKSLDDGGEQKTIPKQLTSNRVNETEKTNKTNSVTETEAVITNTPHEEASEEEGEEIISMDSKDSDKMPEIKVQQPSYRELLMDESVTLVTSKGYVRKAAKEPFKEMATNQQIIDGNSLNNNKKDLSFNNESKIDTPESDIPDKPIFSFATKALEPEVIESEENGKELELHIDPQFYSLNKKNTANNEKISSNSEIVLKNVAKVKVSDDTEGYEKWDEYNINLNSDIWDNFYLSKKSENNHHPPIDSSNVHMSRVEKREPSKGIVSGSGPKEEMIESGGADDMALDVDIVNFHTSNEPAPLLTAEAQEPEFMINKVGLEKDIRSLDYDRVLSDINIAIDSEEMNHEEDLNINIKYSHNPNKSSSDISLNGTTQMTDDNSGGTVVDISSIIRVGSIDENNCKDTEFNVVDAVDDPELILDANYDVSYYINPDIKPLKLNDTYRMIQGSYANPVHGMLAALSILMSWSEFDHLKL